MKVSELIAALLEQDQDAVVVIEMDDEYWQVADVDGAVLEDPTAKNPMWLFDTENTLPNAVRICV